jgi:hypothetical protein
MKYKGYTESVTFDEDAEIFHGEVEGQRDVVTFQGATVAEIKKAFKSVHGVLLSDNPEDAGGFSGWSVILKPRIAKDGWEDWAARNSGRPDSPIRISGRV